MRVPLLPLLLATTLSATDARPYLLSPDTHGLILEDCWPSLPVGLAQIPEIRRKAASVPWAQVLVATMRREATELVQQPVVFPAGRAGWRHDFYDPLSGAALVFSSTEPPSGINPAQRAAWVLLAHERLYRLMRGVALLGVLDDDAAMRRWVVVGLLEASRYFARSDVRRQDGAEQSHYHHHLYDAAMVSLIADAWSCVRQDATEDERQAVESGIFAVRLPVLKRFLAARGTHNMSAFVAQALAQLEPTQRPQTAALVGKLLTAGLRDGFWFEQTMFYHFYTATALCGATEIAGSDDVGTRAALSAMLAMPWRVTDSELRLPLVGDLGAPRQMDLRHWRHLYEWAAGRLDYERFSPVLAAIYATGVPRQDLAALAYGPDALPAPAKPATTSDLLPEAGFAVLRSPQLQAVLRGGPAPTAWHDHPDRLGLLLDAPLVRLSPDLGEPGYGLRKQGNFSYFRTTAAHNTLFVDEAEQRGGAALAAIVDGFSGTLQDASGAVLQRRVWVTGATVVVLDSWEAVASHRYGWVHHASGEVQVTDSTSAVAQALPAWPKKSGFTELSLRETTWVSAWAATWAGGLTMQAVADGPVELSVGSGPGNPYAERQGVVLLRLPGAKRRLATVFAHGVAPEVQLVAEGVAVAGRVYRW